MTKTKGTKKGSEVKVKKPSKDKQMTTSSGNHASEVCEGHTEPKPDNGTITPYREIVLSDGSGFYIRTICNLTSDARVQVSQYREHVEPDGTKFACTEPIYFENKSAFLEWLVEMLKKNFDEIPYITISPVDVKNIKKHEREATDTMYL
ncbi:hypothetical protein [[Eubacterium] cellulosolvens]